MGNIRTEKKKRRLRRKKERTESQQKETLGILCISCGNQERTVDDTSRCESCRRDVYDADYFMCDFD